MDHVLSFAEIDGGTEGAGPKFAETRAQILERLFETPSVTGHDAATINDRLDPQIEPSVVLINPPFSAAPKVEGRFRAATAQHVRSALARLRPNGRVGYRQVV